MATTAAITSSDPSGSLGAKEIAEWRTSVYR